MITEVLAWGMQPYTVTTDAWYSSSENLRFIRDKGNGLFMGIAKNRSCSINGRDYTQVQNLEIPEEGSTSASKKFWESESISKSLLPRGDASRTKTESQDTISYFYQKQKKMH